MDNRLNCILELSFHRDHVPVVPHRYDAVLNGAAIGFAPEDILEHLIDGLLQLDFLTTDGGDVDRCVVEDVSILVDTSLYFLCERRKRFDVLGDAEPVSYTHLTLPTN